VRSAIVLISVIGGLVGVSIGCVANEQDEMNAARARYEECIAEKGEDSPDCDVAHQAMLEAQARYENTARMRWGCEPGTAACPVERY